MHKIFVIIALVFLIAGSTMFGWIYIENKKEQQRIAKYESKSDSGAAELIEKFGMEGYDKNKLETQLRQEQHERLQADLDVLASGEKNISPFADILYGEGWQEKLNQYKKKKELNEFVLTSSIVCISMGGTIFSWYLVTWLLGSIKKVLLGITSSLHSPSRKGMEDDDDEPAQSYTEKDMTQDEPDPDEPPNKEQSHLKKQTKAAWSAKKSKSKDDMFEQTFLTEKQLSAIDPQRMQTTKSPAVQSQHNSEDFSALLSDEKSTESLAKLEHSLKAQTEQLEERTAESVQKAIMEQSQPLDSTLKDLAQQVSAIREYASCQQERVEKLQDGYDWNIIKTFCLRIIRCIDNLENRIERLSSEGTQTEHLDDIRDELVFALESSGIEQYRPEINSDYRGQEKYAEAVKEKEHCDDANQKGKIARVIRPGYQYFINEENVKIVRTAQVKLFG
jgi:molecular chaperone GrpE (heat shock protein)